MSPKHVPILVSEILEQFTKHLDQQTATTLIDVTIGSGGHTEAFLKKFPNLTVIGLDQDPFSIEISKQRLGSFIESGRLKIQQLNFNELSKLKDHSNDIAVDAVFADLGYSSDQLESSEYGMSFKTDGPLDMRLDPNLTESAYSVLQTYPEKKIREIFLEYGEERFSFRFAAEIVRRRSEGELPKNTAEFAEWIKALTPKSHRYSSIHPATRVFQALRIFVNNELENLTNLLNYSNLILKQGGLMGVISFHSLEDRIVKNTFKQSETWNALTKKPLTPTEQEIENNPRSRSAKFRIAKRIGKML